MNERIKELAVEAGMIVGEANGFDMTRMMPREVKFAELILQKALTQVDNMIAQLDSDGETDQALGAEWAGYAIAKHFGIK
jgi:hypothetical protein